MSQSKEDKKIMSDINLSQNSDREEEMIPKKGKNE